MTWASSRVRLWSRPQVGVSASYTWELSRNDPGLPGTPGLLWESYRAGAVSVLTLDRLDSVVIAVMATWPVQQTKDFEGGPPISVAWSTLPIRLSWRRRGWGTAGRTLCLPR